MSQLSSANRVYLIGIKGVGMTGLAQLLKSQGKTVWGSDTSEHFFTNEVLQRAGIECLEDWNAAHLERQIDVVVRSTAYGDTHPEVAAAKAKGIPVLSYPEALGEFVSQYKSLAVTGSHGKTTTTAMLAHVLHSAGLAPSALVGSQVPQFAGNALVGSGELFVFEADEYQNKLQYYKPQGVILTSIQWDHPDFFPSAEVYQAAFMEFLKKIPADGFVVACYDSESVKQAVVAANLTPAQVSTYGLSQGNTKLMRMWLDEGKWHFSATEGEEYLGEFWLKLVGSHNVANALAVIACARRLGVDIEKIRTGLASFEGTSRRFEQKGRLMNSVMVVDDYAHHPAEIAATLKAARAFYPYKQIRCVFMPHTWSRTRALFADFGTAFKDADEVVLMETYASAREQGGGVSIDELATEIKKHHPNVVLQPTIAEAAQYVGDTANRNQLVITMGAGNVWQVGDELIKRFGLMTDSEFK